MSECSPKIPGLVRLRASDPKSQTSLAPYLETRRSASLRAIERASVTSCTKSFFEVSAFLSRQKHTPEKYWEPFRLASSPFFLRMAFRAFVLVSLVIIRLKSCGCNSRTFPESPEIRTRCVGIVVLEAFCTEWDRNKIAGMKGEWDHCVEKESCGDDSG